MAAARPAQKTSVRHLTLNVRLSDLDGPSWRQRCPRVVAVIKRSRPSVISLQECTTAMRKDILRGLGKLWDWTRHGNSCVMYDKTKWTRHEQKRYNLTAPLTRRLVVIRLVSKKTGGSFWLGGTHLTVHTPGEAAIRVRQVDQIVRALPDGKRTAIGGDWNDTSRTSGVRGRFRSHGFGDLRAKTPARGQTRTDLRTFHGYKASKTDGVWLDDIITGSALKPYGCEVVLTGSATDHNGILARYSFTG